MNIKDLQVFLHLSQSLHFNQTAQATHITPSTLTRLIKRLESEYSQVFFERDNRTVTLTPAGKRFVEFADNVIAQWRQLKQDFNTSLQQISGELTIYCTVTAAHLYLPGLINQLRTLHPEVEINLETGDVALAYQKIADRSVDFAFAVAPDKPESKFVFQHIQHIPFKLIAPRQATIFSKFMTPGNIDWSQLPFVMPESGPAAQRLNEWLELMKIKPEIYAQVSGHEAIVSMIALGCGVSAVPQPVLEYSPVKDKVQVLPVSVAPRPFDFGMVCLKKRLDSPLMQAFWNIVSASIFE